MEWLWTWSGKSFGFKEDDNLWTHDGRHVGRFHGEEIYSPGGSYLGEIRNKRLITKKSKKSIKRDPFPPYANRVGQVNHLDYVGNVMVSGYEDFPKP